MFDSDDIQLRFVPPSGPDSEWNEVDLWTDDEWRHWLRQHNDYPFLKQWTEDEIDQYLLVDRFKYGFGLGRKAAVPRTV